VILTIDEGLRDVFLKHRKLLKEFMDESVRLVKEYFEKKHKVTPGIIAGLHTFGSRLNFNPHVHMLVTMGGMKKSGEWKSYDFIPFEARLQKAYSDNGEGFYVYPPKQKGNVKQQLGYIGRYMGRPAIAVHRIKQYDGEYVVFTYVDKTDGQEKLERITVEEFIARLIRHIPDEQFKTIRYYGVYSRRIKSLCKRLVSAWRRETRKWITKAKRTLKRRNWRERMKEKWGEDPMVCPKCENYYEYKGELCLEQGVLQIKYAKCLRGRACLERMIADVTVIQETKDNQEKEKRRVTANHKQLPQKQVSRPLHLPAV
jgi:hypothetical protein